MPKGVYDRSAIVTKPDVVLEKLAEKMPPTPKGLDVFIEDGRYIIKDDNEPLCLNCNHRKDRHHVWREIEHQGVERDMYGNKRELTWITKHKKFDVSTLPCQHACKCENYK